MESYPGEVSMKMTVDLKYAEGQKIFCNRCGRVYSVLPKAGQFFQTLDNPPRIQRKCPRCDADNYWKVPPKAIAVSDLLLPK